MVPLASVRTRLRSRPQIKPIEVAQGRAGLTLTTRRYRRIFVASLITLLTSATLLGLIGFMRWRRYQALQGDTHTIIVQTSQQLLRSLQSRRGTLTFLRDTLNRRTDLTEPQLQAMGASAVDHTRHLLGVGLIRDTQSPTWWSGPKTLSRTALVELNRSVAQRAQQRGAWRVPSTFIALANGSHPLLVMLEPVRAPAPGSCAIVGVFDVKQLLEDFFAANLPPQQPVQLLDRETPLYRSSDWTETTADHRPIIVEQPVAIDAAKWLLQLQPGPTHVIQTLSWFHLLVVALCILTGIGVTVIVWLLATRTWILQRVVARRTAALRRTTRRLHQLATTDELTGLHNRRFFLNRWDWECARAKRYQRPLACLMIDVNGFKQVNDRLGHQTGDLVLKQVAQELKTLLRQSDILARFGGDEFVIALPETTLEQATAVAEKLRQASIPIPEGGNRVGPIRLSVGLSQIEQDDESPQEILQAADQSLYAWKRSTKQVVNG